MTVLLTMLRERAEEFDTHHALAVSLEDKIFGGENVSIGGTRLSVRHLLTMKSGLIVHLYNILESIMSQATKVVGSAVGTVPPRTWSESARRGWCGRATQTDRVVLDQSSHRWPVRAAGDQEALRELERQKHPPLRRATRRSPADRSPPLQKVGEEGLPRREKPTGVPR